MILILMKTPWKPSSLTVEDYIIGTPLPSPALNLFLRAGTHAGEELIVRFAGEDKVLKPILS